MTPTIFLVELRATSTGVSLFRQLRVAADQLRGHRSPHLPRRPLVTA